MDFQPLGRAADASQEPVQPWQVCAMCRWAFGPEAEVAAAVELGGGYYNTTYRVEVRGVGVVILRIAPPPGRQYRLERHLMRNEYASIPYLAPVADLLPRTLAVDFTHRIIARDYLFQTHLDGVQASEGLNSFPQDRRHLFWRQLGEILSRIHTVRGPGFGRVAGPWYGSWSQSMIGTLADIITDLDEAGLEATDLREVAALARGRRAVLNEITQACLLHGDLLPVNVMIAPGAPEPTIVGIFDCDRTSWGDPMADWTMFMIGKRPQPEAAAFWAGYGTRPGDGDNVRWRSLLYRARNLGEVRLEHHRLGNPDGVARTYPELADVAGALRSLLDHVPEDHPQ